MNRTGQALQLVDETESYGTFSPSEPSSLLHVGIYSPSGDSGFRGVYRTNDGLFRSEPHLILANAPMSIPVNRTSDPSVGHWSLSSSWNWGNSLREWSVVELHPTVLFCNQTPLQVEICQALPLSLRLNPMLGNDPSSQITYRIDPGAEIPICSTLNKDNWTVRYMGYTDWSTPMAVTRLKTVTLKMEDHEGGFVSIQAACTARDRLHKVRNGFLHCCMCVLVSNMIIFWRGR